MYPQNFTELSGLIGILVPLIIATCAGLRSTRTKVQENDLVRWRRINDLAATLYNKDGNFGLWAQLAAAYELGETASPHKGTARVILLSAQRTFKDNPQLHEAMANALIRIERKWWQNLS